MPDTKVTEASMRADPGTMQPKRLYAEQLVDAIVEVAMYKTRLEELKRTRFTGTIGETEAMLNYAKAREIAVQLVIAEEAGQIL